jgi:hypothetical protein
MRGPHVINPRGVYTTQSLQAALGLTKTTIGREIRLGRLRVTKRAGKYFVLGTWVLEWLAAGEVCRSRKTGINEEVRA